MIDGGTTGARRFPRRLRLHRPRLHRPQITRRRAWQLGGVALGAVALGLGPPLVVAGFAAPHLHSGPGGASPAPVAIVLGAGVDGAGNPTTFLAERLQVAADLYRTGRVRALLMSGDNSRKDYDEVGAMATRARQLGVPAAAIVQDHAGFDTYSSCYRARSVWGISRAIVVTQPFHLTRAVWTCRRLGIDAQGAATGNDAAYLTTWYGWVREVPAIDKAIIDVWTGRTPTFPGPREHVLDAVNAAG
jgi:vancomycin permeability regulator SanA